MRKPKLFIGGVGDLSTHNRQIARRTGNNIQAHRPDIDDHKGIAPKGSVDDQRTDPWHLKRHTDLICERRCTGLGRKLIEAVCSVADTQGAGTVLWLTQEFNATARQLYDRIATKTPFVQYSSART